MSSDETQAALSRAFELVEAGQNEEARAILDPILAANPQNADAWWVYAHAADDPDEGQAALEKVIQINPNYPGAAELLAMARERFSEEGTAAPPPPSLPEDVGNLEPNFDEEPALLSREPASAPAATGRRRGSLIGPIIAIIIIVVLVALVVVSQLGRNAAPSPTETPTEVVSMIVTPTEGVAQAVTEPVGRPTPAATESLTEVATIAPILATEQVTEQATEAATELVSATEQTTAEATGEDYAALQQALAQFPLVPNGVQPTQTSFGPTLQITACSVAGRDMRILLPKLMNAFALQGQTLDRGIKAFSVHLINCNDQSPLVTVAVGREASQAYAGGLLTDAEFAARWKSQ